MPLVHPLYAQAAASRPTTVDSYRLTNLDPDQPINLVLQRKKRPKPARISGPKARDKKNQEEIKCLMLLVHKTECHNLIGPFLLADPSGLQGSAQGLRVGLPQQPSRVKGKKCLICVLDMIPAPLSLRTIPKPTIIPF